MTRKLEGLTLGLIILMFCVALVVIGGGEGSCAWRRRDTTSGSSGTLPVQVTLLSPDDGATDVFPVNPNPLLTWTPVSESTSYVIYLGTSITPSYQSNVGNTSWSPGPITETTVYYWRIDARNDAGDTPGDVWSFTTTLNAPSSLYVTVMSPTQIDLSWTDNSNSEDGFKIERKDGVAGTYVQIDMVGANVITYPDTGVIDGTDYWYRVRAYNASSDSAYSNVASTAIPLDAPTALTATFISSTQIDLSWTDNSDNEDGFKIERKTGAGGYIQIDTVITDVISYSDTVSPSTAYYYQVRAYNAIGNSAYSNEVNIITDGNWTQVPVAAGGYHTVAIKNTGTLWAWGLNDDGQLGLGHTNSPISTTTQVGIAADWSAVVSGEYYTIALKPDGTLRAWGDNVYGQLGLGDKVDKASPTPIGTDTDWTAVACGGSHTLAISTTGSASTIWAWGRNDDGQLGLGDSGVGTEKTTPTQVTTDTDWSAVACGGSHTLALKTGGTFWAWGLNSNGQLGLGDWDSRITPTLVSGLTGVITITGGAYHTIVLKNDGTLWAWGRNDYGQLGLGDQTHKDTPTKIGTATDWSAVAAGRYHTLARKSDGTLWAWGRNDRGQLGLGSSDTNPHPDPVQVGTDIDWTALAAGNDHTIVLKANGTLSAWGLNADGQLGLGDQTDRNTPNLVGE